MAESPTSRKPVKRQKRQKPGSACEECRRRKLRCDRVEPQCGLCEASGVTCEVSAVRPPRGPKRGYLKAIQARLEALEGTQHALLKRQQSPSDMLSPALTAADNIPVVDHVDFSWDFPLPIDESGISPIFEPSPSSSSLEDGPAEAAVVPDNSSPGFANASGKNVALLDPIGAASMLSNSVQRGRSGLSISRLMQADLDQLYFDRVHTFIPILHQGRWRALRRQQSKSPSQTALQYTVWLLAAAASANYLSMRDSLYQQARELLESLDMQTITAQAPSSTDVEQVQAWVLLTFFDLRYNGFRRGWITAGRVFRLIQLDRRWLCDADASDPTRAHLDLVEAESKRRTFWMAYCLDSIVSLRIGSAPTFNGQVTSHVRLPASEADFQNGHLGSPREFMLDPADDGMGQMPSSEFIECIYAAKTASRGLWHRQQYSPRSSLHPLGDGAASNAWDQAVWFDTLAKRRMHAYSRKYPLESNERRPMQLFLAVTWRAIVLSWQQTMGAVQSPSDEQRAVITEHEGLSEAIAQDILRMAINMSEMDCWQLHPLMTIPLSLCGDIIGRGNQTGEALTQKLCEIADIVPVCRLF